MGVFEAGTIYPHLNEAHGGAFEHEAADEGAFARQREFEANQRRREAGRNAEEGPRVMADIDRLAEERRNRLLRQRQAADAQARQLEDLRRAQAYQEQLRAARQRQADQAAAAERQRRLNEYYQAVRAAENERNLAREQVARRQAQVERKKDESWCVVM